MIVSPLDKLEYLLSLFESVLDDEFRVKGAIYRGALTSANDRDRERLMGDPIRYFEIIWLGPSESEEIEKTNQGKWLDVPDVFEVLGWYEWDDKEHLALKDTSDAKWMQVLRNPSGPAGVLTTLYETPNVKLQGKNCTLSVSRDADVDFEHVGSNVIVHTVSFTVTIIG